MDKKLKGYIYIKRISLALFTKIANITKILQIKITNAYSFFLFFEGATITKDHEKLVVKARKIPREKKCVK